MGSRCGGLLSPDEMAVGTPSDSFSKGGFIGMRLMQQMSVTQKHITIDVIQHGGRDLQNEKNLGIG